MNGDEPEKLDITARDYSAQRVSSNNDNACYLQRRPLPSLCLGLKMVAWSNDFYN